MHQERLHREALQISRAHPLPLSFEAWQTQAAHLREVLHQKLHIPASPLCNLDFQIHGEIFHMDYKIQRVSYASAPRIRVTASLYIPAGKGPFPAVIAMHGHSSDGKVAPYQQNVAHLLVRSGFVVLLVDAAGSGERGEKERVWEYHGAAKAGQIWLSGDTLLGLQVRDNMRGVDALAALPFVDSQKIGATGASGGGNQTMWLSALDARIQAAVPVVSVGSFEAYVTRRNCMCETLPGGLLLTEEWGLMGLTAPRPMLVLTALHDQPAFGYEAVTYTSRQVQEIYQMHQAYEKFDVRILDMHHGYKPQAQHAMLGWMKMWLQNAPPSAPAALPTWSTLPAEALICYPKGERPSSVDYKENRRTLAAEAKKKNGDREALAECVGWKFQNKNASFEIRETRDEGSQIGAIYSPRQIPLPVFTTRSWKGASDIQLILSPFGKKDASVEHRLTKAREEGKVGVSVDLPAVGELAWEDGEVDGTRFHDASRACIWLGYTLAGEWAESVLTVCRTLLHDAPHAKLEIVAERETAFAALIALALHPDQRISLTEVDVPESLAQKEDESLVWFVPGFLQWGDLDTLRKMGKP